MKILALDTSNQALVVSLVEDERLVAELCLTVKKNHSITLLASIDFLVHSVDWEPKDLDRIVVAEGPGSYTGLRIAVATAKTLAHTLHIDLVGVSSLLALVPASSSGLVVPLINARRNTVYAGFYEDGQAVYTERHAPFEEVLGMVSSDQQVTFVGEVDVFREQIEQALPHARSVSTLPSAYQLAKLGRRLPAREIHRFVPNYLKRVEAEENWLKDHVETNKDYIKRL